MPSILLARAMCARMVWVFDDAKGIWVQTVVFTPEAQWELEGIEEYHLPATYYNVTPTYNCAILRIHDDKLRFERARWGIQGGPGMGHNAKAENLDRAPLWRQHWGTDHCIIVADGFYEWDTTTQPGKKLPHYFHRHDRQPLAFAGLMDPPPPDATDDRPQATIVTCPPNATLEPYHDRMPVILEPNEIPTWLSPHHHDKAQLKSLLDPAPDDTLTEHAVTPDVNKSTNSWPELLEPYRPPGGAQSRLF